MTDPDISDILGEWDYDPHMNARIIAAADGCQKLQIRLRLGLIQMELDGRPDAQKPYGCESVLEYYRRQLDERDAGEGFVIDHDAWEELSAEGILFYERYAVLFQLGDYERTACDTERNLAMFDLVQEYAERPEDVAALEQYRPYLIRMNRASTAMSLLQQERLEEARATIEQALRELDELDEVHTVIFEQEMHRARSMLEGMLREIGERYEKPSRLDAVRQELERAVREERYEDAARLRDHLRELGEGGEQPE